MRQTLAILVSILCGALLAGCGGDPAPTPLDLTTVFPADNALTGWTQNMLKDSKAGPTVFSSAKQADISNTDVDGDVKPFADGGFKQLARENYKNGTYTVDLRVWEMGTATGGATIYTDLLKNERYNIITWTDEAIGEGGRYGNSGVTWRVNAYKKAYLVEALLTESEQSDTVGRDAALEFVKFVVAKIP